MELAFHPWLGEQRQVKCVQAQVRTGQPELGQEPLDALAGVADQRSANQSLGVGSLVHRRRRWQSRPAA